MKNMKTTPLSDWMRKQGWSRNPFTFSIDPKLLVGYKEQGEEILTALQARHKLCLLVGPTGSGKTTLLKWISSQLGYANLYISKPPQSPEGFADILNQKFKPLFWKKIKNIYQIPDFLNKRIKDHFVILCDEIHESNTNVLEWLRIISDHVDNLSIVLSGLPSFEEQLKEELETLRKRIAAKTELLSLTKEETRELIMKRVEGVGGHGHDPFTTEMIDIIFEKTGGFPREIIRFCDELVKKAAKSDRNIIMPDIMPDLEAEKVPKQIAPKQKMILELLIEPLTPREIADRLEGYKSRQHAIRSVNNLLKRMMNQQYIERKEKGKTFVYSLTPKFKTIFIKK